jgi:heat shock protein HtpX
MNLFSYWFSDKIVLRRYSAREVTNTDNSRLYQIVEKLSASADLPMLAGQKFQVILWGWQPH